jgi:lysine 2,3-aminomutase
MLDNRFEEKITAYIESQIPSSEALMKMYKYDPVNENYNIDTTRDILLEKAYSPAKGLVYKYPGRILFLLSYTCAANCRFCERQDRVGVNLDKEGRLDNKTIDIALDYIAKNKEISEVIFSGGDPLTNPLGLLHAIDTLEKIDTVKIWRLHTKFPIQMPSKVNFDLMRRFADKAPIAYLSLHINHPDELTKEVIENIIQFRKMGFILLSQSVFLKGINDDLDILKNLFTTLSQIGVRPYYIYHCQKIVTTNHFVMNIEDEIEIMSLLREQLSGIAFPNHVIDIQNASGKIVLPTNHWGGEENYLIDFKGNKINLNQYD